MTIVLALLLAACLLLAVPLDIEFDVRWPETDSNRLRLGWAFGIVKSNGFGKPTRKTSGEVATEKPRTETSDDSAKRDFFRRALRDRVFRQRLWRLLGDIWRTTHRRDVSLHAEIGLDTPADTGLLWSVLGPVSGVLSSMPGCTIDLKPDFDRENFLVNGRGAMRIYPIQVVGLFLGLLLSPHFWRMMVPSRA